MRKELKVFFYLILLVVVLVYFFSIIDLNELLSVLSKLTIGLLLFLAALQIITQALLACKWHLSVKAMRYKITFARIFAIHLTGALVENITPAAKAGGDPARIYFLHKEDVAIKDALAVASVNKYLDMASFTILLFLFYVHLAANFAISTPLIVAMAISSTALALLSLLGIFLYMNEKIAIKILQKGLKIINRFKSVKLEPKIAVKNFKVSVRKIMQNKALLIQIISISVVVWLLYPLKIYLIFHTLGSDVSFGLVAFVTFVAYLIGMIPVLPGGIGLYEGSAIALYGILGVPLAEATVAVIIGRIFTFGFVSLMGALAAIELTYSLNRRFGDIIKSLI